ERPSECPGVLEKHREATAVTGRKVCQVGGFEDIGRIEVWGGSCRCGSDDRDEGDRQDSERSDYAAHQPETLARRRGPTASSASATATQTSESATVERSVRRSDGNTLSGSGRSTRPRNTQRRAAAP